MSETKRAFAGRRYFSKTEQDDFSTPETLTFSTNFEEAFMNVKPQERVTDENEMTGYQGTVKSDILTMIGEGRHVRRVLPHEAAFFLAFCMGKVTQDQPDAVNAANTYRHWIERDLTSPIVPAFTMVETNGATKNRYQAAICKAVKLMGERGQFVRLEADLMSKGEETNSTDSDPGVADSDETYLRYGDGDFTLGGSLSGSVAGGDLAVGGAPTSHKADLRSFEFSIDNGATPLYEFGDDSGYATRFEIGPRFTYSLSAQVEFQDDSFVTAMSAETEYVLNIPLIGATIEDVQKYTVDLIFPKVKIIEPPKSRDGNTLIQDLTFEVMEDTTYGTFIAKVINKQQGYKS